MDYNFHPPTWTTYNFNSAKLSTKSLFFTPIYFSLKLHRITRILSRSLDRCVLSQQIFLGLLFGLMLITSYSSLALTTKTLNVINGNAPYLTFDVGQTQVTNIEPLFRISLSDGRKFTPASPNLNNYPIELPVAGQSFLDIGMLVPTNTDSIALSSLIGPPYNYWGDDDGDGQGGNGITVTGSLSLSIVDKNNQIVSRNTVLTICNAPYKLTLSNSEGTLKTRYGVPNESHFSASNISYYINPKAAPKICFVKPYSSTSWGIYAGSDWYAGKGFLPQSFVSSNYGLNFPTTGANNLSFDLDLGGVVQPLTWKAVSPNGDIKATISNSTNTSVRVTLTGPSTDETQWGSTNPGNIVKPSLPQVFELVGLDNNNNEVLKYGFVLKQWFVSRGNRSYEYVDATSWCKKIGDYRLPYVKDLTNASFEGTVGGTPASSGNYFQRNIGAGFIPEWGVISIYPGTNFNEIYNWTADKSSFSGLYIVNYDGSVSWSTFPTGVICVYP